MSLDPLLAITALDGRYRNKVEPLAAALSEFGLLHARVEVECRWFAALAAAPGVVELPALNEAGFYASAPQEVDDLKLISGVGPKLERLLNGLGIYQYQQIALMTSGQVAWVNEQLSFKGRIERDNWIKQAALLGGITTSTSNEQSA